MKKEYRDQSEKLALRMAGYGLTAGAMAITAGNVSGQVYYSGIQNLVFDTPGILNPIDLNGDGVADFNVGLAWDSYILNSWSTYSAFIHNPGTTNGWIGSYNVFQISEGYYISLSRTWTDNINSYYNLGIAYNSNFLGAGNAFIGVRFIIQGTATTGHYGWIRVNIDAMAEEFVVVDWAYEESHLAHLYCGDIPADQIPPEPDLPKGNRENIFEDFTLNIKFSEPVTGFEITDIQVEGGRAVPGSLQSLDDQNFTVAIHPEEEGRLVVSVPGSMVTDSDGNLNMPGDNKYYVNYIDVPKPLLSTDAAQPVNTPFEVILQFSEDVTDLVEGDFIVSNAHIEAGSLNELDPSQYRFILVPEATGFVMVELPAHSVVDADMHGNLPAEPLILEADFESPRVLLYTNDPEPVDGAFTVYMAFGEPVEGLRESDLRVTNGFVSAGTLATDNNQIFSIEILPAESGEVMVHLPGDAAQDADGNGNIEGEPLVVLAELPSETEPVKSEAEFLCYPNPAAGMFMIHIPPDWTGSTLIIYNNNGLEVFRTEIDQKEMEVNPPSLSPGVYMLRFVLDERSLMKKVVIE